MRVLKFGGKSLSSKNKCFNICNYIKKIYSEDNRIIIVVSAIGNTTDTLFNQANEYVSYYSTINNSKNSNAKNNNLSKNILINGEIAKLVSTGENQSASLMALMLISMGINAISVSAKDIEILTYGEHLDSKVLQINKSKLDKIIKTDTIAIVTGFQGINEYGQITTLGRGGSDTTSSAIASLYGVPVEIYSDYNGIFSGDPKFNNFKKTVDISTLLCYNCCRIGDLCNGSTADSDSVCLGSSPRSPARKKTNSLVSWSFFN